MNTEKSHRYQRVHTTKVHNLFSVNEDIFYIDTRLMGASLIRPGVINRFQIINNARVVRRP